MGSRSPRVLIIIGSKSDMPVMDKGVKTLNEFGISSDLIVASAHRNPKEVVKISQNAHNKFDLVIAGAGMAAHLPGVVASNTLLPVIGVPIYSESLSGFDALYSIVQMPPGIPVATVAINGAVNAAILAAEILAAKYPKLSAALVKYRKKISQK